MAELSYDPASLMSKRRYTVLLACLINLCAGANYAWSIFAQPLAAHLSEISGEVVTSGTLAFAFSLAAEIERNLISQRTKSSLANLKASGKKLGRPFSAESKKLKLSKNAKKVRNLLAKGISKSQIAKVLGVQRSTLRRFIERMA